MAFWFGCEDLSSLSPRFLGFLLKKTDFLSAPLLWLVYFLVLMLSFWSVPMEKSWVPFKSSLE